MGASLPLELVLKLNDQASGALNGAKSALGSLNLGAVALGGAAVAGVTMLAKGLWDCAKAAGEEEAGIARLSSSVKASGGDWDTASEAIEAYLSAELRRTALDDGDGRESISRLTQMTGDYRTALELMPLAQDLARAKGMDLAAASEIVGKVHEGNTGILKRYGITLGEDATAEEALAAMQTTFAGQAEAYGNTFAGSQAKMDIAMGNLKETVGAAVLPVLTSLITTFSDLAVKAMPYVEVAVGYLSTTVSTVMPVIQSAIETAVGFIIPILDGLVKFIQDPGQTIFEAFKQTIITVMPIVQNAVSGAIEVVKGVLAGLQAFWGENGATIQASTSSIWNGIKSTVETVINIVRGVIATVVSLIHGDWSGAWTNIKATLSTTWEAIKSVASGAVSGLSSILSTAWGNIWNKVKTDWGTITSELKGKIDSWIGIFTGPVGQIWNNIFGPEGAFTKMRDKLGSMFDGITIKTPHISVTYTEIPVLGRIPSGLDVQWYGQGGDFIAHSPTLIGVGERGAERVTVTPLGSGGGGGGPSLTFVYSPVMSLANEVEAYSQIAPVIREVLRREARRG